MNGSTQSSGASLQRTGYEFHYTIFSSAPEFIVSPDTPQKLQYLREQAAVIKLFEERFTSIWENVIILAKEGKEDTKQSFQVQEN